MSDTTHCAERVRRTLCHRQGLGRRKTQGHAVLQCRQEKPQGDITPFTEVRSVNAIREGAPENLREVLSVVPDDLDVVSNLLVGVSPGEYRIQTGIVLGFSHALDDVGRFPSEFHFNVERLRSEEHTSEL